MVKLFEILAWLQYLREAEVDVVGILCFYFTFGRYMIIVFHFVEDMWVRLGVI